MRGTKVPLTLTPPQEPELREKQMIRKNKKAQIKIQQMAFMLIAVFIFFILVGLFAFSFKSSGLRRSAEALEEKNALLSITTLANSPEFSCGNSFESGMSNCIDSDKIMVLKDSITKYSGFWEVSNIIIRRASGTEACTRGNYDTCGYIDLYSKGFEGMIPVENFITLCRKVSKEGIVQNSCEIAKLIIYNTPK